MSFDYREAGGIREARRLFAESFVDTFGTLWAGRPCQSSPPKRAGWRADLATPKSPSHGRIDCKLRLRQVGAIIAFTRTNPRSRCAAVLAKSSASSAIAHS